MLRIHIDTDTKSRWALSSWSLRFRYRPDIASRSGCPPKMVDSASTAAQADGMTSKHEDSPPQEDSQAAAAVLPGHRVPAHLARRFNQICLGAMAEVLDPHDLSPIEYSVLAAVCDKPGVDQRRLGNWIGADPTSTSQMVDRLEGRGFVERRVDRADRRARLLHATRAGLGMRRRYRAALLAAQARIMASLSAEEQDTLIGLLSRIVESNDAYARPGNGRRKPKRRTDAPGNASGVGVEQG